MSTLRCCRTCQPRAAPVEHLTINTQGKRYLYAFTHGRGVWRIPI